MPKSKQEWAAFFKQQREDYQNKRNDTIRSFGNDKAAYIRYLQVQSRMTAGIMNTVYISATAPDAVSIADAATWESRGYEIKKGYIKKSIKILERTPKVMSDGTTKVYFDLRDYYDETAVKPLEMVTQEVTINRWHYINESKFKMMRFEPQDFKSVLAEQLSKKVNITEDIYAPDIPYLIEMQSNKEHYADLSLNIHDEISPVAKTFALAKAAAEIWINEYEKTKPRDIENATNDAAYMILFSKCTIDPAMYDSFIDNTRFRDAEPGEISGELKFINDAAQTYIKAIVKSCVSSYESQQTAGRISPQMQQMY